MFGFKGFQARILVLALAVLMASGAQAAERCEAFFASKGKAEAVKEEKAEPKSFSAAIFSKNIELEGVRLKADREAEQITSKKDPRYKAALSRLLGLLSDAIFLNASEKMTIEKGELRLGKVLSNGLSIEFEYEADTRSRTEDQVFHLKKILAFKPNGQEIQLSKDPLTDDGLHLRQKDFVFAKKSVAVEDEPTPIVEISALSTDKAKELAEKNGGVESVAVSKTEAASAVQFLTANKERMVESDREKVDSLLSDLRTVEVPVVIQGEMLKAVIEWAKRSEYLKKSEIRKFVDSGKVSGLVWKSRYRRTLEFIADRTMKKAFGAVLMVGFVVAGGAAWDEWKEFKETIGGPRILKEQVETVGFSPQDVALINDVLRGFSEQWSEVDPRLAEKLRQRAQINTPRNPIHESYMFNEYITRMWNLEVKEQGKVRLFVGGSKLNGLTEQSVPGPVADPTAFPGAGVMIYHFEKMKQIAIASVTFTEGTSIPSVRVLIVRDEEYPVLYDVLKKRIRAGFEQQLPAIDPFAPAVSPNFEFIEQPEIFEKSHP